MKPASNSRIAEAKGFLSVFTAASSFGSLLPTIKSAERTQVKGFQHFAAKIHIATILTASL